MPGIVLLVGPAAGGWTPHNRRWLVAWNPHTEYGMLECNSTSDRSKARRFESISEVLREWSTVSCVQPVRPDGKPNKPLTGMTIAFEKEHV